MHGIQKLNPRPPSKMLILIICWLESSAWFPNFDRSLQGYITATCLVLGRQLGSYSAGVEPKDHQKIDFFPTLCPFSFFPSLSLFLFLFHKSPSHQAINYSSFCVFLGGQMGQMDKLLELRSHFFCFSSHGSFSLDLGVLLQIVLINHNPYTMARIKCRLGG